jgi:hypothetical protein
MFGRIPTALFFSLLLSLTVPAPRAGAQNQAQASISLTPIQAASIPVSWIGMSLDELYSSFGAPSLVRAERGLETWQDDVVFSYEAGDFYIYRDRVWQVSLAEAFMLQKGNRKEAALLMMGSAASDWGNCLVCPISGGAWPLALRCNIDEKGLISEIIIYRSDM